MSGLGFLLICRGRSRANICFIFHSFWWSSSVTPPRSPWETGGGGTGGKPRHHLSFLRKGQFWPGFSKNHPQHLIISRHGKLGRASRYSYYYSFNRDRNCQQNVGAIFVLYLLWLRSPVWRNVECDVCCCDLRERKQMVQSAYVGTSRNGWCC